jgi:hypothetical protein
MRRPLTLAALAVLAVGCGGSPPPAPAPAPVATTVQLSPSPLELAEHQQGRVRATVLDQTWARMDLPILWQTTDPAVATVVDSAGVGVVTAVGEGTALLSARAHTQVATVQVKVVKGLVVDVFQSDAAASASAPAEMVPTSSTNCFFELAAVGRGGAPGDSATWEPSQIEFVQADMSRKVDSLGTTEMLDRFGSLVIRDGDTLRTRRLVATPVTGGRVVYRVRYAVGGETRSNAVTINCSRSPDPTR